MNHYNVAFISLGCDKNRINCEQMMYLTQAAGHFLLPTPEGADVCVINTCGFIDAAKEEAIGQILQVAQLKEAGQVKKILVSGCLAQRYREEIKESLPEVDGILGTGNYTDIVQAIEEVMADRTPEFYGDIDHTGRGRSAAAVHPGLSGLPEDCRGVQQPLCLLRHPQAPGQVSEPSGGGHFAGSPHPV